MAVSPVRAVLAAHFAATWNRSARELGKVGAAVFAAVMALVLLAAAGPTIVGSFLFGALLLGPRAAEPGFFAPLLGGILFVLALLGGLVGGILGGSRVLAWEAYRAFPLRTRTLFLAELVAGLGDPLCLAMAVMSAFLLLGVGTAVPAVLPLLPPLWIGQVVLMLSLQHLVGGLAGRAVKRLQVGLALLGTAAALTPLLVPALPLPSRSGAHPAATEPAVLRVRAAGARLGRALRHLPQVQAARGLAEARQGRWGSALMLQAPLLGLSLLAAAGAALTLRREAAGADRVAGPLRPERLWSFSGRRAGVARLHWHNLLGSQLGRFSLLMPLLTLALLKGPLASLKGVELWAVPAAFGYLSLTGIQFQINLFGLDGRGVRALLLLPVSGRDLLAGKLLGLAAFQGLQALMLLVLLGAGGLLGAASAGAGLCLAGCLFLAQAMAGHWTSLWLPRPMPRDSLKNSGQSPLAIWIGMGVSSLAASCFGLPYLLAAWRAPALLLPTMAGLLVLTALTYRRLILPAASAFLERRREALGEALG